MKYTLHVPVEQYGFVEAEMELSGAEPQEAVKNAYDAIKREWEASVAPTGIPEKELNAIIDKMLLNQTIPNGIEIYERMSQGQKDTVQAIKRGLKRVKGKDVPSDVLPSHLTDGGQSD